jgi:hypothetical protein
VFFAFLILRFRDGEEGGETDDATVAFEAEGFCFGVAAAVDCGTLFFLGLLLFALGAAAPHAAGSPNESAAIPATISFPGSASAGGDVEAQVRLPTTDNTGDADALLSLTRT